MKFWHVIHDGNHLVSLAKNLADIATTDEHDVQALYSRGHQKSYLDKAQAIFPNVRAFDGRFKVGAQDIVVLHGLFGQQMIELCEALFKNKIKTAWCMWGGDLHMIAPIEGGTDLLNKFDCIISYTGELALYPDIIAPEVQGAVHIIDGSACDTSMEKEKLILLGNSGDPSNDHPYLLEIASKFDGYQLWMPFAYNGTEEYKAELLSKADELGIRDRLTLQEDMLPFEDYSALIARAEMIFAAHNRQQALGTMGQGYLNNCRVFMRKTILSKANKTMANPGYLQMLSYGWVSVADICDLEHEAHRRAILDNPNWKNEFTEVSSQSHAARSKVFDRVKRVCFPING